MLQTARGYLKTILWMAGDAVISGAGFEVGRQRLPVFS